MQLGTFEKLNQGTKIEIDGMVYVVLSCVDMTWLTKVSDSGYLLTLERVEQ